MASKWVFDGNVNILRRFKNIESKILHQTLCLQLMLYLDTKSGQSPTRKSASTERFLLLSIKKLVSFTANFEDTKNIYYLLHE